MAVHSLHRGTVRRFSVSVVAFLTAAVGLAPLGPGAQADAVTAPPPLKVVTFNTCGQSSCRPTQDLTDWAADLSAAILAYGPDAVGIQEVCGNQYGALAADLPGYTVDFNQAYKLAPGNGCDHWDAPNTAEPPSALEFGDVVFVKTSESPVFHNAIIYPDNPSIEYRPLECAEARRRCRLPVLRCPPRRRPRRLRRPGPARGDQSHAVLGRRQHAHGARRRLQRRSLRSQPRPALSGAGR